MMVPLDVCVVALIALLTGTELLDAASDRDKVKRSPSGAWGTWSDWTSCSRTCDAGVQSRFRTCIPLHGSCLGNSKGFRSCSGLQKCSPNSPDYRSQQCSQFNRQAVDNIYYEWLPVDITANKCILNCKARGYPIVRQSPAVVDGTRCTDDSHDMCVDGRCMPAGCDGMLGSTVKLDRCGACGGDGTSCVGCNGTITRRVMLMTYNKLLTIPRHARMIEVKEIVDTTNVLALRKHSTEVYYLNGGVAMDLPGRYNIAGTSFDYKYSGNDGYSGPEKLKALGPTSFALDVMLRYQTLNHGVRYSYALPRGKQCTPYTWHHRPTMTRCSATCGGGHFYRPVNCINVHTGTVVDDRHCTHESKPTVTYLPCNNRPCPASWKTTEWSHCSVSCGQGTQTRQVVCLVKFSAQFVSKVSDIMCTSTTDTVKPSTKRSCMPTPCPATWVTGEWSQCSGHCGWGTQTRTVRCNGNGLTSTCDSLSEPPSEISCHSECLYYWYSSPWSDCSATCNSGLQSRLVSCFQKNGERVNNQHCNYTRQPEQKRRCRTKVECGFDWFTGPWSECSASCGTGRQTRKVACISQLDNELEVYPNKNCKRQEPASSQRCVLPKCPPLWYATEWSCCHAGQQNRSVLCSRGPTRLASSQCGVARSTLQHCNTVQCNEPVPGQPNIRDYISRDEDPPHDGEPTILPSPTLDPEPREPTSETPSTSQPPPTTTEPTPTPEEPIPTTEEPAPAIKPPPSKPHCKSQDKRYCLTLKMSKGMLFPIFCKRYTQISKNCCATCNASSMG